MSRGRFDPFSPYAVHMKRVDAKLAADRNAYELSLLREAIKAGGGSIQSGADLLGITRQGMYLRMRALGAPLGRRSPAARSSSRPAPPLASAPAVAPRPASVPDVRRLEVAERDMSPEQVAALAEPPPNDNVIQLAERVHFLPKEGS